MANIMQMPKGLQPVDALKSIPIKEFFKKKDVFITGATGFMGKVLVEKLLWSCEDIGNIYVLIRPKKDIDAKQRCDEMLKLPVFDRIKEKDASLLSKLVPISGDVIKLNLGINDEDRRTLEENVSVVIHAASSVRFDDPLKKAIILNVRGTRNILDLSKNMKKLKVMVYVSTTYANVNKKIIEEKVYESTTDWRSMIELVEQLEEFVLNILTPKILNDFPNTYTFSKNLAESLVNEYRHDIPTIIYRPSIVANSYKEPVQGWVDNLNGPIALSAGVVTGFLHTIYGDGDAITDYMPCDFAINALIATAWYRGLIDTDECIAINAASGHKKNVTTRYLVDMGRILVMISPPHRMLWYPLTIITQNRFFYLFLVCTTHLLPALLVDIVLRIRGDKFRLMTLYRKVFIANEALRTFLSDQWKFSTDNFDSLSSVMRPEDTKTFYFDLLTLDNTEAIHLSMLGIKKYIFHDDESNVEAVESAKKKFLRLYYMDRILKGSLVIWIAYVLYKYIFSHALIFTESLLSY